MLTQTDYNKLEEKYQQSPTAKLIERRKAINSINDNLHISDKAFAIGLTAVCIGSVVILLLVINLLS